MTNIVPKVSINEFNSKLTDAMNGNKQAIQFIDSLTINRADGMGFDMYSKTSFWSDKIGAKDSICACVSSTYSRYQLFRNMQK
jgi:hypothetical protein